MPPGAAGGGTDPNPYDEEHGSDYRAGHGHPTVPLCPIWVEERVGIPANGGASGERVNQVQCRKSEPEERPAERRHALGRRDHPVQCDNQGHDVVQDNIHPGPEGAQVLVPQHCDEHDADDGHRHYGDAAQQRETLRRMPVGQGMGGGEEQNARREDIGEVREVAEEV